MLHTHLCHPFKQNICRIMYTSDVWLHPQLIKPLVRHYSQPCDPIIACSLHVILLHLDPINRFLICRPPSDVSHLTVTQPLPSPTGPPGTTTTTTDVCHNVQCLNDGICVVDEGKAACRCVLFDKTADVTLLKGSCPVLKPTNPNFHNLLSVALSLLCDTIIKRTV